MSEHRTAWHVGFGTFLRERGPLPLGLDEEVPLAEEALRMDYLLHSRSDGGEPGGGREPLSLRRLWARLCPQTVMELKSIGRPYRPSDLEGLWAYTHLCQRNQKTRRADRNELGAVLVIPCLTPTLRFDVDAMRLRWEDLGAGYWEVHGGSFRLHVVEIDRVSEAEDDDFLRCFSHDAIRTVEAKQFWARVVGARRAGMTMSELEGYEDMIDKLLGSLPPERRLAGLPPEQRLAGLAPEQRLADLSPEEQILALSDELLHSLPEDFVRTLPSAVQGEIRRRLGRAAR